MIENKVDRDFLVDNVLVHLIKQIEGGSEPVDITLIVGSFLITGKIISYQDWFNVDSTENNIEQTSETENPAQVEDTAISETDESSMSQKEKTEEFDPDLRRYIHLKDAKIYHGGFQIPSESAVVNLRIKLVAVDGWMEDSLVYVKREPKTHTIKVNGKTIDVNGQTIDIS